MKLGSSRLQREFTPLEVSGALNVTGGSIVQFYDGQHYTPDREGSPSSPIKITHNVDVVNPDEQTTGVFEVNKSTVFYGNDVIITSSNSDYTLSGNSVIVKKNTPPDEVIEIKAVTKFVDKRTERMYSREDVISLRTIVKDEGQYQLDISDADINYFDAYRNPNVTKTLIATLEQNNEDVVDYSEITFKWLNKDGLPVLENELYANSISTDGTQLEIDKSYISKELISCEAWKDGEVVARDSVTFVRKYNSFRTDIRIPELPLQPNINKLTCELIMTDTQGNVVVDNAFFSTWIVNEWNIDRDMAYGSKAVVDIDDVDLNDNNLSIYPDIKRKESYGALAFGNKVLTDNNGKVLTGIKLGK